jgi:hypothetical protein
MGCVRRERCAPSKPFTCMNPRRLRGADSQLRSVSVRSIGTRAKGIPCSCVGNRLDDRLLSRRSRRTVACTMTKHTVTTPSRESATNEELAVQCLGPRLHEELPPPFSIDVILWPWSKLVLAEASVGSTLTPRHVTPLRCRSKSTRPLRLCGQATQNGTPSNDDRRTNVNRTRVTFTAIYAHNFTKMPAL